MILQNNKKVSNRKNNIFLKPYNLNNRIFNLKKSYIIN